MICNSCSIGLAEALWDITEALDEGDKKPKGALRLLIIEENEAVGQAITSINPDKLVQTLGFSNIGQLLDMGSRRGSVPAGR